MISEHRLLYMKLSANLKVERHAVKVQRWHPFHIALGCFIHALHKKCTMQFTKLLNATECKIESLDHWAQFSYSGAVCIYSLTQIHMIGAGQLAWFRSTIIFALWPASGLCMSSHAACLHTQSLFGTSDSLAWASNPGPSKKQKNARRHGTVEMLGCLDPPAWQHKVNIIV